MKLIPAGDLTSAEPVLPVRWCLGSLETEQLKECQADNIQILLVIAYERGDLEDRQLLPIDQMIGYLTFRQPGHHTVFAKIVHGDLAKRLVLKDSATAYRWNVFENYLHDDLLSDAEFFERIEVHTIEGKAELEVEIPEEHFPKEPPAWQMRLANIGFDYPPIDQCSFRRRFSLALPKLFFMGIWAGLKMLTRAILVLLYVLSLARGVTFGPIIHPWRDELGDVGYDDTWFSHNKYGRARASKWIYCLHPLIWIGVVVILDVVAHFLHKSLWKMLSGAFLATVKFIILIAGPLVSLVLMVLVLAVVVVLLNRHGKKQQRRMEEWKNSDEFKRQEERKKEQVYDDLALLLACKPAISAELSSLPPDRRTFNLKFLDLKRKVCRPYATK